jgi:hypothetical protein
LAIRTVRKLRILVERPNAARCSPCIWLRLSENEIVIRGIEWRVDADVLIVVNDVVLDERISVACRVDPRRLAIGPLV